MTDDTERHATNLELFLDLVFVFAVTQIASLVSHDLTLRGAARGSLITWLVWWQWSQFTWVGSAADLQRRVATRVLVLCTIPATLTMAVSVPHSFHDPGSHDSGPWFGVAYMAVQLLVLGMQGTEAMRDTATRQAFIDFASVASLAPLCVMAGGFANDRARLAWWIAAALINVASAIRGASGEWSINPVHFAERHTLFVIISLGEAVVAIGATASEVGLSIRILIGLVAAASVACVLWWVYFTFIPSVAEHTLEHAGGCLHIQWRVIHRLAPERFVAIAVIAVWLLVGSALSGSAAVGGIALVLAVMQAITWRRYRAGPLADAVRAR